MAFVFLDGLITFYISNDRKFSVDFEYGFIQILEVNVFWKITKIQKKIEKKWPFFGDFGNFLRNWASLCPRKALYKACILSTPAIETTAIKYEPFYSPMGANSFQNWYKIDPKIKNIKKKWKNRRKKLFF